ncbi:hypothetical protein AOQ84DRAFT_328398, partial [Glonium stellatum]
MEHQKCYVFAQPTLDERAAKRRRVSDTLTPTSWSLREDVYRRVWSQQQQRIQATVEDADLTTLENLVSFVSEATVDHHRREASISSGLIVVGPSIASHGFFFDRLGQKVTAATNATFLILTSGECPNLKTLLRNLIRKATSKLDDVDEPEDRNGNVSRTGPKLLDYDLVLLQEWYSKTQTDKVIVAVQDSEAFDAALLVEMIELFSSWLNRIPFVLLFGVATSSESFQDRLPGTALRRLRGETFNVKQANEILEKIFCATIDGPGVSLRLGPNLSRRLLERQKDHIQSVQAFSDALKYAHMSHFYANPLSIFLSQSLEFDQVPSDVFRALRNLPSFRRWAESLLDKGCARKVRRLLDSDQYLYDNTIENIKSSQMVILSLVSATSVLVAIRNCIPRTPYVPRSTLYVRATSGELDGSPIIRETLLMIRKASSDLLYQMLEALSTLKECHLPIDIGAYQKELDSLVKETTNETPLRSQHDVRNNTLRTTVVAQKVELSKQRSTLSEQDTAYSGLVGRFHDDIENYFTSTLILPQSLVLSEILLYDLKSPHSETFTPRPRFVIERSLSSPHDYLDCSCCLNSETGKDSESMLSPTQPATAILYQLYLESGSLVNVSDLWSAFNAIVGEEDDEAEPTTMSLFQRALAELKFLGLLKSSRKKSDHVAKMMWKGL